MNSTIEQFIVELLLVLFILSITCIVVFAGILIGNAIRERNYIKRHNKNKNTK